MLKQVLITYNISFRQRAKTVHKHDAKLTQEVILMSVDPQRADTVVAGVGGSAENDDDAQLLYEGLSSNFFAVFESVSSDTVTAADAQWQIWTAPNEDVLPGTVSELIADLLTNEEGQESPLRNVQLIHQHPRLSQFLGTEAVGDDDKTATRLRGCFITSTSRLLMTVGRILVIDKPATASSPDSKNNSGALPPTTLRHAIDVPSDQCAVLVDLQRRVQAAIECRAERLF